MNEGRIVGIIRPADEEGAPPVFEVLRRDRYEREADKSEECDHKGGTYFLDEKWNTVRCSLCNQKLDPFCVLVRYAEWGSRLESKRRECEDAIRGRWIEELRRVRGLKGITEDERAAVTKALMYAHNAKPEDLKALAVQTDRAIKSRRTQRTRPA